MQSFQPYSSALNLFAKHAQEGEACCQAAHAMAVAKFMPKANRASTAQLFTNYPLQCVHTFAPQGSILGRTPAMFDAILQGQSASETTPPPSFKCMSGCEDVGCTWVARETMHLWPPTLHLSAWLAPVAAAPSFSTTTLAPAIVFFMSP